MAENNTAPVLQSTTGRPLPSNIEAEKSVLAACMLNPDAIDEIATKLAPENFFRPAHQRIFEKANALSSAAFVIYLYSTRFRLPSVCLRKGSLRPLAEGRIW